MTELGAGENSSGEAIINLVDQAEQKAVVAKRWALIKPPQQYLRKKEKNRSALWTRIKNGIPVVHGKSPLQETRVLTVHWNKCQDGTYWPLERLNLENVRAEGVYVIWHGGALPRTVRVGQGIVAERLRVQRFDSEVLAYKNGGLYVTWAAVSEAQRDGVGKYLADLLHPRVEDVFPDVRPIVVNSPWG